MANILDYGYIRWAWQGRYRLHTHILPIKCAILADGWISPSASDIVVDQGESVVSMDWKVPFGNFVYSLFDNLYTELDTFLYAEFFTFSGQNQEPVYLETAYADDLQSGWDGTGGSPMTGVPNTRGLVLTVTYSGRSEDPSKTGIYRGALRFPETRFAGQFTDRPTFTNPANPYVSVAAVLLNPLRRVTANPTLHGFVYLRGDGFPSRIIGMHQKINDGYVRVDRRAGDVDFGG